MAKKRYRICNNPRHLVKVFLLHGILISSGAIAEVNTPGGQPDGIINDTARIPGIDLYLDVTLNGNHLGLAHFGDANGKLYASANTLRQLGFRLPKEATDAVSLNNIDQLKIDYDVQQQTLNMTVPLSQLDSATTELNGLNMQSPAAAKSRGMLLNYDLYAAQQNGTTANSFTEFRAFNSEGVFSSTQLTRYSEQTNSGSQGNEFSRLDTSWRSSFPDKLLAVTVGDTLTSSLSWSRPTRIAGIQIGTDYSLQPYLRTAPLPTFLGSATLPSSVELFVNGMKYYNGQVPSGNFAINTMPNISGAGNAQVVMTDALGRTTTQNFSFYNDQQLLREGLKDWSAEVGVVRKNYGYASNDYGSTPAASGTWRYGVSNTLTTGIHSEATDGLANGGVSSDWIPGSQSGTISTSLAFSTDRGQSGSLYSVGYRWAGTRFSFGASTTATTGNYHDVATHYGTAPPALNSNVVVGYDTGYLGNVSLSYLQFRYPQESAIRYANANWFKSVAENVYLSAGYSQNMDDKSDRSVYLMVSVTLDNRITASTTVQRTNNQTGYQVNASQSQPSEGGWGWNVAADQQDSQQSGQGEVGYLGRYGNVYTGFNNMPDNHYGYAGASGSLVMMGGGLFAAREITNGFAVVSTDGVPDVPVKLQNNPVGTTNNSGLLLVTPLNSYQKNLLSIDPMSLPANTRITRIEANATPGDRSGTLVNFTIESVRAAQVVLTDARGKVIPEGSQVRLNGDQSQTVPVGFDGMAYFDTLKQHNTLQVTTNSGTCSVQFDYPAKTEGIPQIGPLACK
ncbi:fimbria/pilus outer membrane usher protein [Rouxiella badensis]|jgi:outer membrane usher protein|uniref:fimbria/pilus outer membrane usher protein n=1 Tax=Rouxiella badensis TaxID=1646377 RepID=UPI00037C9DBA|nr:fimbria/pilus outer membrane usher protein [Rouxiella badensis]MCC3701638.1 fimbria/pilus outer membrane usher protein [Rouxiella badensis]MCC3719344.1 fimbria/pilus outer membrane usher protein [Rouxiella badensis]MCC3728594.1 fimbria/pilus outer membrane usher protein [Rouxiella badensis]MCC3735527.1 fimbria/pilus outer membrane usher protein [Rouxiella badensis]MCC3739410.1 fimbria/pilus outer membrane usher protein [Rouxiella badensis]